MIRSFADEATRRIYHGYQSRAFPAEIQRAARRKLRYLDAAHDINDLRAPPGNKLKKLTRERAGQHSIRINQKWRICFTWDNGAHNVEINNHYED